MIWKIFPGLVLVSCVFHTSHQEETSIECPFPEGTSISTEVRCNDFTACVWSGNKCHMNNDISTTYVAAGSAVMPDGTQEFYWNKPSPHTTLFGYDVQDLTMKIIPHENHHLQIKIVDTSLARYEVPIPLILSTMAGSAPLYDDVIVSDITFGFQVARNETGNVVLSTVGPLTYEDQFIQITFRLASSYLYGIGENTHLTLRHPFEPRTTFPVWARAQGYTEEPVNLMGQHPLFMVMEDDEGRSHSVFLLNSNPMESSTFLLDDGSPALTLRATGGIIDMHIFMGPFPEDLNKQYTKMIGLPALPPYYYLGFQLSRYGYNNTDHVRDVVDRNRAAGVPQEIQTVDINYMDNYRIFTYDKVDWGDLPQLADELHNDKLYLTVILDPPLAIDWDNYPPAQRGKNNDVYIKWASPFLVPSDQDPSCDDYVVGYMWPDNKTVYPDFLLPKTKEWWATEVYIFHDTINFDTLWIDMNEPANFGTNLDRPYNYPPTLPDWSLKCPDNKWDTPPYPTMTVRIRDNPSGRVSDGTLCMSSAQSNGTNTYIHYDVHSLYGLSQAEASYHGLQNIFPTKRSMVLSRSTYPGYGKYGAHWLGDNHSTWNHMRLSIIGILEFNMFGIPMVGADICGHFDEPSPELCARWTQLGAFYTFSRNHNNEKNRDQDPASWGDPVSGICKDVLLIRYTYLPYLYTLLYKSRTEGSSVLRPLFNVFPRDYTARDVQDQFLWGTGLMVAPVIEEGAVSREVYFPQGTWYNLHNGGIVSKGAPVTLSISAPLEVIPLFFHGGTIVPGQEPDTRTSLSRLNPMKLVVALNENYTSEGELFWDDGTTTDLTPSNIQMASISFAEDLLLYKILYGSVADQGLIFDQIQILGNDQNNTVSEVLLNGVPLTTWSVDNTLKTLTVNLQQPISEDWTLQLNRN